MSSLVGAAVAVRTGCGVLGAPAGAAAVGAGLLGRLRDVLADRLASRPTCGGGLRAVGRRVEAGPDAVFLRAARSDAIGVVAGGIEPDAALLRLARSDAIGVVAGGIERDAVCLRGARSDAIGVFGGGIERDAVCLCA